jgi:predicted Fe-Mo cluster-binding NifX family protein
MKRLAIPISNNRLSEFFGQCEQYEIFDIDREITARHSAKIPSGIDIREIPAWIEKQGITDVIAYKVNPGIIKLFASKKVNLYVGIQPDSPQNLIDQYLKGNLESDQEIINELINSIL